MGLHAASGATRQRRRPGLRAARRVVTAGNWAVTNGCLPLLEARAYGAEQASAAADVAAHHRGIEATKRLRHVMGTAAIGAAVLLLPAQPALASAGTTHPDAATFHNADDTFARHRPVQRPARRLPDHDHLQRPDPFDRERQRVLGHRH
jgi:hypothetical protein